MKYCKRCKCMMTDRDADYCTDCLPLRIKELEEENEKIKALLQRFKDIIKTGGIRGENLPVQIAMGDLIEDIKALEGK